MRRVRTDGDDVWWRAMVVRHGVRVRPVREGRTTYRLLPGALLRGLKFRNVLGGGNDVRITVTCTAEDLARWGQELEQNHEQDLWTVQISTEARGLSRRQRTR